MNFLENQTNLANNVLTRYYIQRKEVKHATSSKYLGVTIEGIYSHNRLVTVQKLPLWIVDVEKKTGTHPSCIKLIDEPKKY